MFTSVTPSSTVFEGVEYLSFAISRVFQSRDKSSCSKSKSSLGLEIPLRETLLGLHMCKVESLTLTCLLPPTELPVSTVGRPRSVSDSGNVQEPTPQPRHRIDQLCLNQFQSNLLRLPPVAAREASVSPFSLQKQEHCTPCIRRGVATKMFGCGQ